MRLFASLLVSVLPITGLGVACAPRSRTQVTIEVQADSDLGVIQLVTTVQGGTTTLIDQHVETLGTLDAPVSFPLEAALVPAGGDTSRRFRFEAVALDARGDEVGTVRVLSRFVPGRTERIQLRLESCCRTARCASDETCRDCECTNALVEVADAGVSSVDAGRDAGFTPRVDAFSRDAFSRDATGPDAAPLVGCTMESNCLALDRPFSMSLQRTSFAATQCRRPVAGMCPSTVAPDTYGCEVIRLYNPRATRVNVTLQTSASFDSFLSVYDDRGADLAVFPEPPADPAACIVAIDDTPGLTPHASTTINMPPNGILRAMVSTALSTGDGTGRLIVTVD